MQRILLCVDDSSFARSGCVLAAWFATRLRAGVDVLCVTGEHRQTATRDYSGSIGLGASETLLKQLVKLEHEKAQLEYQRSKLILEEAREVLASQEVEHIQLINETGNFVDHFQKIEPQVDLVILGKRGESSELVFEHLGSNVERIVRLSHKPCLVASQQTKSIARLLLAYDGSESCQKMLHFLTSSPAFQGLELHIVTVATQDEDATAHAHLEKARKIAYEAGFMPICQQLTGNSEEEIAGYSEKRNIDLLMMGAYGHSRIRHLVIGSTTSQLLRSSHIPVLVFR